MEFTTTQTLTQTKLNIIYGTVFISNFYQLFVLFKIDHFVFLMETHDHVSIYTCNGENKFKIKKN